MGDVRVTSAAEAAAGDARAIAAGVSGFSLMATAGTRAAEVVVAVGDAAGCLARGVHVFAGAGNNGGDGWVVAAQLARLGVRVHVHLTAPPRTPDAQRAEAIARRLLPAHAITPVDAHVHERMIGRAPGREGPPGVVVDALLGTGASGPLRGAVADAAAAIARARALAVPVVSLDIPTGVDATTGAVADGHVRADVTVTFGTLKQGLLGARTACGRVLVVDIGLGAQAAAGARLAEPRALRSWCPRVPWDAHKGTRGRLLVIGGARGMAGAAQLVAQGALHSGVGLVRALVDAASVPALQAGVPAAVCVPPGTPVEAALDWAHAAVLGPGLGRSDAARRLVSQVLAHAMASHPWQAGVSERDSGSVGWFTGEPERAHGSLHAPCGVRSAPALVLDADAIRLLADADGVAELRACAAQVPVVLTPHGAEAAAFARACGVALLAGERDVEARLAAARAIAEACGAHVLLKGAPTLCAAPDGAIWCVPRGGPVLATGGTGDVLAGVLGAVLAGACASAERSGTCASAERSGTCTSTERSGTCASTERSDACARAELTPSELLGCAALAAWVHGVAGECAAHADGVRGATVAHVIGALGAGWRALEGSAASAFGVLADLPSVRT
jgi:hydroxyethylthiazole kinase-like uncharacterized protein yjeF